MLNNRLEDLIYKYKSYKIKIFIKNITAFVIFLIVLAGLFSLYKKATCLEKNKTKSTSTNSYIPQKNTNIKRKPKIVKIKKEIKLNDEEILKIQSIKTLILLEKNKPTYQTAYDLANHYFKNKDYENASKWAMIAGNRAPQEDKTWIIYAKSKIKLGQKGMAKKALKLYLLKYKSQEISNLLNSI